MTVEQLSALAIEHGSKIAGIEEQIKSAHKRIDNNSRITESIHKLAANVESLTFQVKMLAEKVEENVSRLEASLKRQGERIGVLEKEPAQKWKDLTKQVISIIVASGAGFVLAKIFQ